MNKITRDDLIDESISLNICNPENENFLLLISEALNHPIRIKILQILQKEPVSIPKLASMFYTSVSTMVYHTEMLRRASLIDIVLIPGVRGSIRVCYRLMRNINLQLFQSGASEKSDVVKYICKVGDFVDTSDNINCNFATLEETFLSKKYDIFNNKRHEAGLIWADQGYLVYAFPNSFAKHYLVSKIEIALEICSECLCYNNHYESDITFWLNGVELLTWTCPGDFGDRPGVLSPEWWKSLLGVVTQYGMFLTITVDGNGVYLNGDLMNDKVNLKKLSLSSSNRVLLKIGNKENAINKGGFNIFGKTFGDYPVDIELTANITKK